MLSNAALTLAIENLDGLPDVNKAKQEQITLQSRQNIYFGIILYSTFALAMIRFVGVSLVLDSINQIH
jgi:chitin synthase